MVTSLAQLRQTVDKLIEQNGEDTYVATWIYTHDDVVYYDDEGNEHYVADSNRQVADDVLADVGDTDYIHSVIQGAITDSIFELMPN